MADPYAESNNADDDTRLRSDVGSTTSTPRWVKAFGIILILVVLLFVILLVTRGPYGPGRHLGLGNGGGQTQTSERGAQQP